MVLGEIVCQVVGAASPVDDELALMGAIFDPIGSHVHGLGASLFDCILGNSCGAGIVWCLNGSSMLWVPHVFKGGSEHGAVFAVVEEASKFCFGG
jgi:hypothetical protein